MKLTDAAAQRFKVPPGQRVEYFDATLPGFGLRVTGPSPRTPDGRKSWVVFYRLAGQQRRLTLEPAYPAPGLAAARRKAGEALMLVAEGRDPAAERQALKAAVPPKVDTIDAVIEEFLRRHMEGKGRAERYVDETRRHFRNHVLPRWGGRDIETITRRDVIELLDAIVDEGSTFKGPDGKLKTIAGGPIAANRVLAALRVMFNWVLRRGVIDSTPAALVERPGQEQRRDRILNADELRLIWEQLQTLEGPVGAYLQTLLLTAQRREEVSTMRWSDVDLVGRSWTIPADATKAGRTHVVPLAPAMVQLLRSLPRVFYRDARGKVASSPWVFTFGGERPLAAFSLAKRRLDLAVRTAPDATGLLAPWTIHDLRRTAATEMGRLGFSRFTIGRVLNHADASVTGIYDRHSYVDEKRAALETWASRIEECSTPVLQCSSAPVLQCSGSPDERPRGHRDGIPESAPRQRGGGSAACSRLSELGE